MAVPGEAFGPCRPPTPPQRPITGGQHSQHRLSPKPKPGPLDPLGPLADVNFLSGFKAPRDGSGSRRMDQGSAGRIGTPRDKAGPRETDEGPAGRSRAPQDESGTRGTNQSSRNRSGPRWTDQVRRIRAPRDESGLRKMNQGIAR